MPQSLQTHSPHKKTQSNPSGQTPNKRHREIVKKYDILLLFFIVLGLFCLVQLIHAAVQTHAVQQEHRDNLLLVNQAENDSSYPTETVLMKPSATESVIAATDAAAPVVTQIPSSSQPKLLAKYAELYQKNNDLIGWLNVNCLYRINFAVVQGKNNYYMNHDFNKQENVNGSAFLDETCKICPRDDNLIIYAHNMKSGEMFGELNRLQNAEKLYQDPFVTFDTLYEQGTYVPLAIFVCSVVQAEDYFQFYIRNFKSEAAFDRYIGRARELSLLSLKTDAVYGDELLTLVTCYDQNNRQRFVVLLRKLRDNETIETVQAAFFQ